MKLHEKIKNHYKENYASSPIEIFNEEIDFIIKHECKCDNCGKSIFEMENYPETRDDKLLCDDCYDELCSLAKECTSFQFLYQNEYNKNKEYFQEYISKKKTLIDAMDDFLTHKKNLYDIDYEVKVTYKDGKEEIIRVDVRQDWDMRFYFIYENKMICGNGYTCPFNGKQQS